ncbi:single-stranded-DNA-specific exonuclease RecJ [Halieaceae bacterium IMCC14734]|uniref:Single-stranded-DNA-specific exonuclease RecJ n=1 Tax=Candidatus Litorirhabdus singularis TaxID=2518993 RepID=A0ABT3THN3_9GAMM|nr:single-stranded-DNA-specific exonuclease RecJ [Candidatus Litorirhabdus singularis]MCX2981786.1 single-stranded-DNA-specific exonuclease RecJ [Candidatus Litorirhabdus singularis]
MKKAIRRRLQAELPAAGFGLHPILEQVYANRGVRKTADLALSLDQLLPPNDLMGLDSAAVMLADALQQQSSIVIVGDFDADGATSTALVVTVLRQLGFQQVAYLVPNRFEYGYGLTPEIVALAAQQKPDIIITVDNGISSVSGVAAATGFGIRTLVTDHHLPGTELPAADVIVNPNQTGDSFASKNLAGVGVIFYVMLALRAQLRERDYFQRSGVAEPNLAEVLDLVALGTVADVVPLDHNNRVLVEQGLKRMRAGRVRPGIVALAEVAQRSLARLTAADLGFALGPRLNAAGRLDDMSIGIECLLADNPQRARTLASELNDFNRDRQQIEREMHADALRKLDDFLPGADTTPPAALCLYDKQWHQGVVGILAARIKERLHRPAIAFADGDETTIKGSARSIPGLHIRDALERVSTLAPGLIIKFGGHAMAAGLSIERKDFERFRDLFEHEVERLLDGVELEAAIESDGELPASQMQLELARQLRFGGPWGQHFPEPVFDGVFTLVQQRIVGERHLKLVLAHPQQPDQLLDAIAFNIDTALWPDHELEQVRVAYKLDSNEFRGRETVQMLIEVLEPV